MKRYRILCCAAFALLVLLAGCGGGGGEAPASSVSAATTVEKSWVRAHLDDVYLWYDEIADVPAANYLTAPAYFNALLVKSRDRFSYSTSEELAVRLFQQGRDFGYGVKWGWAAPGRLFAYYVDPASPASVDITRGMELLAVNSVNLASIDSRSLSNLLFPQKVGASIALSLRAPGTQTRRVITLVSADYSITTVDKTDVFTLPNGKKAGYMLFNQHLTTAEQGLIAAMSTFRQQGIDDLVLDLRYNTGGLLVLAEEVASMIGGAQVQGKVFERLIFNGRHPEKTADPASTFRFTTLDRQGGQLPQLGVGRLFVLTGSNTCSASETIINGLSPHMQVIRIGSTTCGKPYGFISQTNAGQTYFAIQFEGVNALGMADYKYGFAPACQVSDDLYFQLGDMREARLAAALYYIQNNACPPVTAERLPKAVSGGLPLGGEPDLIGQLPALKLWQ